MQKIKILYQDEHFIAIDKPSGYHVHQPENEFWKVPRSQVCLYLVRDLLNQKIFPVHRLDAATSGVLIFALSSESASLYSKEINSEYTHKTYHAVVRGFSLNSGIINTPLKCANSDNMLEAETKFETIMRTELPFAVGKRHTTARYSLIKVEIKTGRYHQIRRHLASISHPLIGDANHGDLHHNKFFREVLKLKGLQLRATNLSFIHPYTSERITINAGWNSSWENLFLKLQWPH